MNQVASLLRVTTTHGFYVRTAWSANSTWESEPAPPSVLRRDIPRNNKHPNGFRLCDSSFEVPQAAVEVPADFPRLRRPIPQGS